MKRLFLILLCLLMLFSALSEEEERNLFACDCGFDAEKDEVCKCFLQEGDIGPAVNGVIERLKERGYLPFSHARGVFDREVTEAVMQFQRDADLNETGVFDHDTLTFLLLDEVFADIFFVAEEEAALAWVPTDGGDHVHDNKECSNMIAPRKISEKNAAALGIERCEHCLKDGWFNE